MPRGYSDTKTIGRPRKVAPPDAVRVGSHMVLRVACPGCGKIRNVSVYRKPSELCRSCNALKKPGLKHGMSHHPVYKMWEAMMMRCGHIPGGNDHDRPNYEGRGITVCEEWRNDRVAFFHWALANGWRKGLQIDREKNDLGYFPDNCRFVTSAVNNRNRRSSKITLEQAQEIKRLLADGVSAAEIGRRYHVSAQTGLDIKWGRTWKEV